MVVPGELELVVTQELENMVTGKVNKSVGLILAVNNIEDISEGRIIHGDGAIYYDVQFEILSYQPMVHEIVEGIISEVTEFGVFVTFGPIDGLIHVSQITEDFMSYDQKNAMFMGKESNKSLKQADVVQNVLGALVELLLDRNRFFLRELAALDESVRDRLAALRQSGDHEQER